METLGILLLFKLSRGNSAQKENRNIPSVSGFENEKEQYFSDDDFEGDEEDNNQMLYQKYNKVGRRIPSPVKYLDKEDLDNLDEEMLEDDETVGNNIYENEELLGNKRTGMDLIKTYHLDENEEDLFEDKLDSNKKPRHNELEPNNLA